VTITPFGMLMLINHSAIPIGFVPFGLFESNFGPRPPPRIGARARELVAQDDKKNDPTFIGQPAAWIVHG
jgi:hypothetical protein